MPDWVVPAVVVQRKYPGLLVAADVLHLGPLLPRDFSTCDEPIIVATCVGIFFDYHSKKFEFLSQSARPGLFATEDACFTTTWYPR